MDKLLGADVRVAQAGALDGLSHGEIGFFAPGPAADTRGCSGACRIGMPAVVPPITS